MLVVSSAELNLLNHLLSVPRARVWCWSFTAALLRCSLWSTMRIPLAKTVEEEMSQSMRLNSRIVAVYLLLGGIVTSGVRSIWNKVMCYYFQHTNVEMSTQWMLLGGWVYGSGLWNAMIYSAKNEESTLSRRGNNLVFILPFGVKQDQTGLEMCYYSAL